MKISSKPTCSCWSARIWPGAIRSSTSACWPQKRRIPRAASSSSTRAAPRPARSPTCICRFGRAATCLFNGLLAISRRQFDRWRVRRRFHRTARRRRWRRSPVRRFAHRNRLRAAGRRGRAVLRLVRAKPNASSRCIRQGVNQSTSGTDKVNAIINCHLATGRIGKPGMGPFSLTGQPNAMGGREVGGLANQLAAHMDFATRSIAHRRGSGARPASPTSPGSRPSICSTPSADGRIKAVWIMATNPLVSMPDAESRPRGARRLRPRRRVGLHAAYRHDALGPCAAARGGVGREGRHRHQLRAPHLAAAAVLAAPRPGAAGLVDRQRGRPPHGIPGLRLYQRGRDLSRACAPLRRSRTMARATSISPP